MLDQINSDKLLKRLYVLRGENVDRQTESSMTYDRGQPIESISYLYKDIDDDGKV